MKPDSSSKLNNNIIKTLLSGKKISNNNVNNNRPSETSLFNPTNTSSDNTDTFTINNRNRVNNTPQNNSGTDVNNSANLLGVNSRINEVSHRYNVGSFNCSFNNEITTTVTDRSGTTTTTVITANPDGVSSTKTITKTDKDGNITEKLEYRVSMYSLVLTSKVQCTYDADGNKTNEKKYTYGRLESEITYNADGSRTEIEYVGSAKKIEITYNADGSRTEIEYIFGDKLSEIKYDADGNVIS